MARSTCATCGVVFSSVSAFDAHRVGQFERRVESGRLRRSTRRCLAVVELVARGMEQNARGWWTLGAKLPAGVFAQRVAIARSA